MLVQKYLINIKTAKGTHVQVKCFNNVEQLEKWVLTQYKSFNYTWKLI